MAKSEAITACLPSTPDMPIPTSAVWIIETSLAPSPTIVRVYVMSLSLNKRSVKSWIPMPRVRMCNCCLTIFTINAFCNGVARQHRTAAQCRVKCKKGFCRLERLSKMYLRCQGSKMNCHGTISQWARISQTYSNVFPSTTKAFRLTTILELSDAKGKKERSRFPVSLALARNGKSRKKINTRPTML